MSSPADKRVCETSSFHLYIKESSEYNICHHLVVELQNALFFILSKESDVLLVVTFI